MGNLLSYKIDWSAEFDTGFSLLPAGVYAGKITKSEVKETKAKNGSYVNFEITLIGGKGIKGRKLFNLHMLAHPNPKCVNIGLSDLKRLGDIFDLNEDERQDTSSFHDKPIGLEVKVTESEEYGPKNEIKKYVEFDESMLEVTADSSTGSSEVF